MCESLIRSFGESLTDEQKEILLEKMFDWLDTDNSGKVTFFEFKVATHQHKWQGAGGPSSKRAWIKSKILSWSGVDVTMAVPPFDLFPSRYVCGVPIAT